MNDRFISLAISEAYKSDHQMKMGCVVFRKDQIVSTGYNSKQRNARKLHPRFQRFKGSIHAEVAAILSAKTDLKNSSLLVIRINRLNQLLLAKPCNHCMAYMVYVGIRFVYYSINKYPYIEKIKL